MEKIEKSNWLMTLSLSAMNKDLLIEQFIPGTKVHLIQARKALEESNDWRLAKINEISEGAISLTVNGVTSQFRCNDANRLRKVLNSGRVAVTELGVPIVFMTKHNVLIVPCPNGEAFFPTQTDKHSVLIYVEDRAARYSITSEGVWNLFSICEISEQVSREDGVGNASTCDKDTILFYMEHPCSYDGTTSSKMGYFTTSAIAAAYGGLRMRKELRLPWIRFRSIRGEHVITPNSFRAHGCGVIIPKFALIPRSDLQSGNIMKAELGLYENAWCWYSGGVSPQHITWQIGPYLRGMFEHYVCFQFYLPGMEPAFPDWLNAEFFPGAGSMIVYGLTALYGDVPRLNH